jgi:mRNA interferase RelE/StbE
MKTSFKSSFLKALKKLKEQRLKDQIAGCIEQVEAAENLSDLTNVKKMQGFDNIYRIRIGDYRIGIEVRDDVVYFVAFAHRKDIYDKFP